MDNGQAIFQGELSTLRYGGQPNSVVVRLIRIWDCIIPPLNMFVGIDFLVVDSQGFGMHGCIPLDAADIFRSSLLEGKLYRISVFEIEARKKKNLTLRSLWRPSSSLMSELGLVKLQNQSRPFLENISALLRMMKFLHVIIDRDVLGLLEAVTDVTESTLPNNKGIVFKRDIYLTLLTGEGVIVRLWNPKVDDLDVTSIARLGYKPLLAIAGLHIKQYQGHSFPAELHLVVNALTVVRLLGFMLIPIFKKPFKLERGYNAGCTKSLLGPFCHVFTCRLERRIVEQLLYTNPAAIKGPKSSEFLQRWCNLIQRQVVTIHHIDILSISCHSCSLRLSLILEHAGFKLRVVVFGTLAHRLTGLDATMLHFAKKIDWKVIPVDTASIINMEYDFVLGVLKRSTGCGMAFKIYQFATIATGV
ncbi:Nucleic acid-binding protein [Corchorus olitorius]|uniref:Nucleic acid-binding protein n=1 Tax=Corchorus olitorius TaxID=93759 RepID=A0A1R3KUR1_9ROSI|nr:Nucleic acid-binding protein [Corchorus olitorius]